MNKKTYSKPELKTTKVELGVFGDYNDNGRDVEPTPIRVIDELNLRME